MTTNEKRAAIARVYPSKSWQEKVAKMSDNQVIAIYQKFLADGKFGQEPLRLYRTHADYVAQLGRFKTKIPKEELWKPNYLGKAIMKENKKEEPAEPKEDFEQLGMDGFIFKKTGKAGNPR